MEKAIILERGVFDSRGLYMIMSYVVVDSVTTAMYLAENALKQYDEKSASIEKTSDYFWTIRISTAFGVETQSISIKEHVPVTMTWAKDTMQGMK